MIAPRLFEHIGFLPEWVDKYRRLHEKIGADLSKIADSIVLEERMVEDAKAEAKALFPFLCEETLCLMLLLEGSGALYEKYKESGLPEEMFYDAMRDLTCKTRECLRLKGMLGTFVGHWYNGFYHMTRFAFGRLQYDLSSYAGKSVLLAGVALTPGDFVLQCHIPSLGPLTGEACHTSLLRAEAFFADRFPRETMIVTCRSYLLFPPYLPLFSSSAPNIARFASHFWIDAVRPQKEFMDAWRIFYRSDFAPIETLPAETALQRAFIRYLKTNRTFGEGVGVMILKNKTIITKNQYQ